MLKTNDIIVVHGWCMLNKLDAGTYRVSKVGTEYGMTVYSFTRPRGKKVIIRHFAYDVDLWIKPATEPDLNKITIKERA